MKEEKKPSTGHMDKATSYMRIKSYSDDLKDIIKAKGKPFGLTSFPYFIKMDIDSTVDGLGQLQKKLGCKRFLCVLGIGADITGTDELKVSFLALDNPTGQVDDRHLRGLADGQETWPPGDISTDPTAKVLPDPIING